MRRPVRLLLHCGSREWQDQHAEAVNLEQLGKGVPLFTDERTVQVRQPAPHDLVGDRLVIAGVGHGFEGTVGWRLLDEAGATVAEGGAQAGGMVVLDSFVVTVDLTSYKGQGFHLTLQVYGDNPGAPDEGETPGVDTNTIPLTLGKGILEGYTGFRLQRVKRGDTLSGIASGQEYGSTTVDAIFKANRDQLNDPDMVHPGQILRIPLVG